MGKKYYYKAMNKDMKCRDFQFKVGEIYTIESEELELCTEKVFHFCEKLEDTINYYNSSTDRHFLIEVLGDIVTDENKSGSNTIRIVREISREEIEEHIQNKDSKNLEEFLALYSPNVETLEILSKDKDWWLRLLVADNLKTPAHILEKLFKDGDWYIRRIVASNPNASVHILEMLSKDEKWEVRRVVADNSNTPVYLLKELAQDVEDEVLEAVAKNLNTPVYILENLAKSDCLFIRYEVASNPNTPVYLLEQLSKDKHLDVSKKAQEKLKEITQ